MVPTKNMGKGGSLPVNPGKPENPGTGSSASPTSNAKPGYLKTPPGQDENGPKSKVTPGPKGVEPGLKETNTPVAPIHPGAPTKEVKPTRDQSGKPPGKDK